MKKYRGLPEKRPQIKCFTFIFKLKKKKNSWNYILDSREWAKEEIGQQPRVCYYNYYKVTIGLSKSGTGFSKPLKALLQHFLTQSDRPAPPRVWPCCGIQGEGLWEGGKPMGHSACFSKLRTTGSHQTASAEAHTKLQAPHIRKAPLISNRRLISSSQSLFFSFLSKATEKSESLLSTSYGSDSRHSSQQRKGVSQWFSILTAN